MVQGGLTCKECGGKEICTLSWCWQHKCGVGKIKIILCLSCPNVSDWLRRLRPSSSGFIDKLQKAILKLAVTVFGRRSLTVRDRSLALLAQQVLRVHRSTCQVVSDSGSLLDCFAIRTVHTVRCRTDYIVDFLHRVNTGLL